MKKLILTVAVLAMTQVGISQNKKAAVKKEAVTVVSTMSEDDYKKEVLKVIENGDIGKQLNAAKGQVMGQIPAEKQAAFVIDFDASVNDLYEKLVPVYMETYTKEDIMAMKAFYESPVGKKMAEKATELSEKSQEVAKDWGQGMQAMMMKYMQ